MRINKLITVTATPINILTGGSVGSDIKGRYPEPVYGSEIFVQLRENSTGLGYVMDGIYGVDGSGNPRIPTVTGGDVTAVLGTPQVPGQPGGSYSDRAAAYQGAGKDLRCIFVHGTVPGDTITVSYDLHV